MFWTPAFAGVTTQETSYETINHGANQLLGSGTSPYANHAEAQAAESRNDFIHKLRICLKELRETKRWIMLIQRAALLNQAEKANDALLECEELINPTASFLSSFP
jgi:four helix bundle protein